MKAERNEEMSSRKIFNLNTLMKDYKEFLNCKEELEKEILENYTLRKMPTKLMVGTDVLDVSYGRVLLNLYLLDGFAKRHIEISKEDLFNYDAVTQDELERYFNFILNKYSDKLVNVDAAREDIYKTLNETSDVSGKLNPRSGNSISYTDFIRLMVTDPEANALFHPQINEGQYSDIEKQFKELGKKLMKYFDEHENTSLYPFAVSGTGLNSKQLTQCVG